MFVCGFKVTVVCPTSRDQKRTPDHLKGKLNTGSFSVLMQRVDDVHFSPFYVESHIGFFSYQNSGCVGSA